MRLCQGYLRIQCSEFHHAVTVAVFIWVEVFGLGIGCPWLAVDPSSSKDVSKSSVNGVLMRSSEGFGLVVFFKAGVEDTAEEKVDSVFFGLPALDHGVVVLARALFQEAKGGRIPSPLDASAGDEGREGSAELLSERRMRGEHGKCFQLKVEVGEGDRASRLWGLRSLACGFGSRKELGPVVSKVGDDLASVVFGEFQRVFSHEEGKFTQVRSPGLGPSRQLRTGGQVG